MNYLLLLLRKGGLESEQCPLLKFLETIFGLIEILPHQIYGFKWFRRWFQRQPTGGHQ